MGHAYTTTICDILARYNKLAGKETYFLTGSDENTQKMVDAANKEGVAPLDFLADIVENFKVLYADLGISYDQFIRTTDQKVHWPGATLLWQKLVDSGDIYKKEYEGLYCVGHEAFVTEKDLVDGKCSDHGTEPQFLKEENYFFRLSKYTDIIKQKIESGEMLILPESRKNEILALLERGLEDISFSRPRKKDWPTGLGISVPGDNSQVMYVWCDALSNYITALGFGGSDETLYKKFWPGMHVIGKDILRFHAAIWPAMLLSAGLPLPKTILVHGFITSGGKKMSKSLGNVIDPLELIRDYGAEAVRYYLARHISPFEDGDITIESFKEAYNAHLANGLGNLVSRIMKMANDNLEVGPEIAKDTVPQDFLGLLENFEINKACDYVWEKIAELDKFIQDNQPFKVVKEDKEKGQKMISDLVKSLYTIARMLSPILPETSTKIKSLIKENKIPEKPLFVRKD
jgi:methionyl-tRNA synthetase